MMLTQERLKEVLLYDPLTGIFKWRIKIGNRLPGNIAGCKHNRGYLTIKIDGRANLAHRLAWLYMTGAWPKNDIDHRDTNRSNNVFDNLREATGAQNCFNRSRRSDNSSGIKGVTFHRRLKKYQTYICKNGHQFHLGYHDTLSKAASAYAEAANRLFGEFAKSDTLASDHT